MKYPYKVGDRVKVVYNPGGMTYGKIAIVIKVEDHQYRVKYDNGAEENWGLASSVELLPKELEIEEGS